MLPYIHHPKAAELAIKHKKHFCTTSYTSDGLKALNEKAKEAGVIMLNECGVDPGTDHMSANKVFDEVHAKGGKIASFLSYAGGLPAPDNNNNPLGYKFSWAPRGVLLASKYIQLSLSSPYIFIVILKHTPLVVVHSFFSIDVRISWKKHCQVLEGR